MTHTLPATGFLRLQQIIGADEVTEQQAAENCKRGKGPRRPRAAIPPLIPVKKSTWWAGVASGRYPQPSKKLGLRVTAWRVEDIRNLIASV